MNTNFKQENVIAYTFAAPNTIELENARMYGNILNIVLPSDQVTGAPRVQGGIAFTDAMWKHGVTLAFPSEVKVFGRLNNALTVGEQRFFSRAREIMENEFLRLFERTYDFARFEFSVLELNYHFFDHKPEVYLAWLMSQEPSHFENNPGLYSPRVNY